MTLLHTYKIKEMIYGTYSVFLPQLKITKTQPQTNKKSRSVFFRHMSPCHKSIGNLGICPEIESTGKETGCKWLEVVPVVRTDTPPVPLWGWASHFCQIPVSVAPPPLALRCSTKDVLTTRKGKQF